MSGSPRWLINAWDYEPRGPSFFVELVDMRDRRGQYEEWDLLEGAVGRFADLCIPQWEFHTASILDSYRTRILGYQFTAQTRQVVGPYGWWFGCCRPFEMLAQFCPPEEVAIWETIAFERAS